MDIRLHGMELTIFCTPKDLRKIADKMEEKIKTIIVGESTVIERLVHGNIEISIVIDQTRMHEE